MSDAPLQDQPSETVAPAAAPEVPAPAAVPVTPVPSPSAEEAPRASEPDAPARARRTRRSRSKAAPADEGDTCPGQVSPSREDAGAAGDNIPGQVSPRRRRSRRGQAEAPSLEKLEKLATQLPDDVLAGLPQLPPRRRGRPSVEERQRRAEIEEQRRAGLEAALVAEGINLPKALPAPAEPVAQEDAPEPVRDVRPGRAARRAASEAAASAPSAEGAQQALADARSQGDAERQAPADERPQDDADKRTLADERPQGDAEQQTPADAHPQDGAEQGVPADADQLGQPRRQHRQRDGRDQRDDAPSQDGVPTGTRRSRRDRQRAAEGRDQRERDGQGQGGQNGRRDQRDQQRDGQQGRDQRDQRSQQGQQGRDQRRDRRQQREPLVPKTNRDELAELKVADLRVKAEELGVAYDGLKKPELVELVYNALVRQEGFIEFTGILDITQEGHGFVRTRGYLGSSHDVYVGAQVIRQQGLRRGDELTGIAHASRPNDKYPGVTTLYAINGMTPEEARGRRRFADLTPVFPDEPLKMEHGKDSILGRCIDLVAPIGKGQRGLIVSPPKAGKTTVLKKIAESIAQNNPEVHLICLLVDERPEEVTDMQRSIKGEVVASTFDMPCENHITVSELVIERAKRLVELGQDVVILLDSITRLARAYNLAQPASGRILSGGVDSAALYPPKRFLGAARNIENGGSLTILASALVETGSKMDEVIFEEFKGTGNMELRLDRQLADRRIFPAIDPISSGTRKEDLLLKPEMAPFVWGLRRILANMNSNERAMTQLIKSLRATDTNEEFLVRSARKAAQQEMGAEL